MYQALYRKWRPQTFSDVVGQDNVTETLKAQVESGRLSHAYLFSGSRGTGKTTCARILSRAVNCENPKSGNPCNECTSCHGILSDGILDVVEIDAASNNGVDYVRELREEAVYSPANVKKRVYIIDEVHMFSASAFNAFLKILEEPPEHVLFILATTEIHKVPATITSRCQRFRFNRLTSSDIRDRLLFIARGEDIKIEDSAADYIASLSDGGLRDAVSLLEQCISYRRDVITDKTIEEVVGLAGTSSMVEMLTAIAAHDTKGALEVLNEIYNDGRNLVSVLGEMSGVLRDLLIFKSASGADIPRISARYHTSEIKKLAALFDIGALISCVDTIQSALSTIFSSSNRRIDSELCMIRLCGSIKSEDYTVLSDKIDLLEKKISSAKLPSAIVEKANPEKSAKAPRQEPKKQKKQEKPVPNPEAVGNKAAEEETADANKLWADILTAAKSELNPGIASIFAEMKPVFSDQTLWLVHDDQFALNMLMKRENIDTLHKYAKECLGYPILIKTGDDKTERAFVSSGLEELCVNLKDLPNVTIKT